MTIKIQSDSKHLGISERGLEWPLINQCMYNTSVITLTEVNKYQKTKVID